MSEATISSVAAGNIDFLGGAVDFDDLAFLSMVMSLQESDQALIAKMRDIRAVNEKKRVLNRDIQRLNEYLTRSSAEDPDDIVYVGGGLDNPKDPDESAYRSTEAQRKYETKVLMAFGFNVTDDEDWANADVCRREEVQNRIEDLRGQIEDLNSSTSLMMIELQRLMNARQQAMQFVSTMESKSHQTALAILNNLK